MISSTGGVSFFFWKKPIITLYVFIIITGDSRHVVGSTSHHHHHPDKHHQPSAHAEDDLTNEHRSGSESESLLNGWIGYSKDNDRGNNMGYNAHFIDGLLPKKLVNLENQRIGHKVSRETNEIYRLFHDIEKHNVKEPEQRLIGELSRLIASKWGLNGNLGYKVPYPHIPEGLTHRYRKIVVNLNAPGSPGETIEEPHVPILSHHHRIENLHSVEDNSFHHLHNYHHHMPIYHNHHLSHKRDNLHPSNDGVGAGANTETGAKRQLHQLRHKQDTVHPLSPNEATVVNTKTGAKRNLQKLHRPEYGQLNRSFLGKLASKSTTPSSWQRAIPESAFPRKADYMEFMRSLEDDWNTLGRQRTLIKHTNRRKMKKERVPRGNNKGIYHDIMILS